MQDSYVNPNVEEDFFDKSRSSENYQFSSVKMRQLSATLNLTGLCALMYLVLLALKLDGHLPLYFHWIYASVPLILSLCSLGWYLTIFLTSDTWRILNPGRKMLKGMVLVASVCLIIFIVLLSLKNDGIINVRYSIPFIPLFILMALALCGFIFIFPGLVDKESEFFKETMLIALDLLLFSIFLITLCLRLDGNIEWDYLEIFSFTFLICFMHMVFIIYEVIDKGWKKVPYTVLTVLAGLLLAVMLVLTTKNIMKTSWFVVLAPVFFIVIVIEYKAASMILSTRNLKSQ